MGKYALFFMAGARDVWSNPVHAISRIIFFAFLIFIYHKLWNAIDLSVIHGLDAVTATWYLALAEGAFFAVPLHMIPKIENDIKSGLYANSFTRPMPYNVTVFFEMLGIYAVRLQIFMISAILIAWAISGGIPGNIIYLPLMIIMYLLSGAMNVVIVLMIGVCYLVTYDTRSVSLIYSKGVLLLGGCIFPLDLYPEWVVAFSKATPFYSMIYLPTRTIYKTPELSETLGILAQQAAWLAILAGMLYFVLSVARRHITVGGG